MPPRQICINLVLFQGKDCGPAIQLSASEKYHSHELAASYTFGTPTAPLYLSGAQRVSAHVWAERPIKIDDSDWVDRARLRCLKDHGWWEAYESTWCCRSCEESYEEFIDSKTDRRVTPSDVRLTDGYRQPR